MARLAIIPARGGSKRIIRKNIKDFLGKPIIAYAIETALSSGLFDEVMVSTEDDEVAEIAKQYGAVVPFMRSKENANDFATTMDVLKEVEAQYFQELNKSFETICCLYPTAPLIQMKELKEGLSLLLERNLDSVFSAVPFSYSIWRSVEIVEGKAVMVWPEYSKSRSQDLKKVYHDAGQWYWYKPARIKDTLFTDNTASIILDEDKVQDIDTLTDWKLAEMKYKLMNV